MTTKFDPMQALLNNADYLRERGLTRGAETCAAGADEILKLRAALSNLLVEYVNLRPEGSVEQFPRSAKALVKRVEALFPKTTN